MGETANSVVIRRTWRHCCSIDHSAVHTSVAVHGPWRRQRLSVCLRRRPQTPQASCLEPQASIAGIDN